MAVVKKKPQSSRSWILFDATGRGSLLDVDKYAIMHRVQINARDLRIIDPLLSYPSTILGREKAIVLNLEVNHIFSFVSLIFCYNFFFVFSFCSLFVLILCFSISRQLSPLKRLVKFLSFNIFISQGAGLENMNKNIMKLVWETRFNSFCFRLAIIDNLTFD